MRLRGAASSRVAAALAGLACTAAIGACGEEETGVPAAAAPDGSGSGGALAWALVERPRQIDPLLAASRADQLVTRQIHEPLVETLAGPFGDVRRLPGLALSANGSAGDTIWSFRLRPGVRFQDGTPLNAGAVLANGQRWRTTPEGQALMPDLFAVDAPRPDLVRFFLDAPDPDFPERLESPRTGIVSPRALSAPSGEAVQLVRETRSGTGPFELRERDPEAVLVARNLAWWGIERDLGPALDQVQFRTVAGAGERLALLAAGDVQVAEELGPSQAREAGRDPLLEVLAGGGEGALGLERSVRGIASAREVPSLSGVWVTRVGGE